MHPKVEAFHKALRSAYPHMAAIVEQNIREFGQEWETAFGDFLGTLKGDLFSVNALARSYSRFSLGILMSQKRYEQSGVYEYSSFDEVKANVYDNDEYVNDEYMPGLLLSHYLWPHHYRLLKFFERDILNELNTQEPTTFCEVGVGTALYSLKTLNRLPAIKGVGYDISSSALNFGQTVADQFQLTDRLSFELVDATEKNVPPVDFLICQEVLEHLKDPSAFCHSLAAAIKPGGRAYITAAITAGQIDHIYLFETLQEIYDMLQAASLVPLMARMEGARTYSDLRYRPRVAAFYCIRLDES